MTGSNRPRIPDDRPTAARPRAACLPVVVGVWLACLALWAAPARAEGLQLKLELGGALPFTAPQSRQYGLGGEAAVGVLYPLLPALHVGATVRGLMVTDKAGAPGPGQVDYGTGTLLSAELGLRLLPMARKDGPGQAGIFVEGFAGAGMTGKLPRALFGAGLGYAIPLGDLALSPFVRYLQVIQVGNELSNDDARLALFGLELAFGNAPPPQGPIEPVGPPPPPPDQDGDGIPDESDRCPTEPEDMDGFEDEDGCPDPDNDGDGVPDSEDDCPDEAEDVDGFSDSDGCPDPDNDMDGFLDADDQCPDDAEVVNGNKDYDGCPDEGLIEFKDDRIVLEERVLFALERARVRSRAKPVLRAIVELYRQHPEWDEIRIEGHADARGDEQYNLNLSERRARNVREELVKLGIPADLMESRGYGSSRLRDRGTDEEAHRRNRRVEFVVLTRHGDEAEATEERIEAPAVEVDPDVPAEDEAATDEAGEPAEPTGAGDTTEDEGSADDGEASVDDGGGATGPADTAAAPLPPPPPPLPDPPAPGPVDEEVSP